LRELTRLPFDPENSGVKHLQTLKGEKPAVNQTELHPFCQQREVVDYCREQGAFLRRFLLPAGRPKQAHVLTLMLVHMTKPLSCRRHRHASLLSVGEELEVGRTCSPKGRQGDGQERHPSVGQVESPERVSRGPLETPPKTNVLVLNLKSPCRIAFVSVQVFPLAEIRGECRCLRFRADPGADERDRRVGRGCQGGRCAPQPRLPLGFRIVRRAGVEERSTKNTRKKDTGGIIFG
jgi:hypothetical protein